MTQYSNKHKTTLHTNIGLNLNYTSEPFLSTLN